MRSIRGSTNFDMTLDRPPIRPGERVFALLLVAGAALMLHEAYAISGLSGLTTGGAMPMAAASVMLVSGLAILADALGRGRGARFGIAETARYLFDLRLLAFLALVAVFAAAIPHAGFMASALLFLFLGMVLLWRGRVVRAGVIAAGSAVLIYAVFRMVFKVVLPTGTLWQ